MSAISEAEEFEFRLRAERESANNRPQQYDISPEFRKRSAISATRGESPYMAGAADILAGATNLTRGILNLPGRVQNMLTGETTPSFGDRLLPTEAVDKKSGLYTVGTVLDPAAYYTGAKAMQAAEKLSKVAPWMQRALGGGAAGGLLGGIGEEGESVKGAVTGGMLGAGISVVTPPVISAAAKGTGWAIDALKGRLADIKAGKVMRDVAGAELPAILAALRAAGEDVTAAQAAVSVGSTRFSALGAKAAKQDSQFTKELMDRQAAARKAELADIAGGQTQTEALVAQKGAKRSLTQLTTPMRETELGAANEAGNVMERLIPRMEQKYESMVDALQNTGRLFADENAIRQALRAKLESPTPGWVKPETVADLEANVLKQRAATQEMNAMKWQRQDEGDFLARQLNSLADYGLKPLMSEGLVTNISKISNKSALAGNPQFRGVLEDVVDEIAKYTSNRGVIDANALYAIKKNVASIVERRLGASEPSVKQKLESQILSEIGPMIDDAITAAGGTGWKNYLKTFSEGMNVINQRKLGAKALEMLQESPESFMALVEGNNPKLVQKIFTTDYDVKSAMGQQFLRMQKVADEVARDKRLSELATAGNDDLMRILQEDAASLRFPPWLNRNITAANKVLDIAESTLDRKTMARVYAAMRSGKSAADAMNVLPTVERSKVFKNIGKNTSALPIRATSGAVPSTQEEQ